MKLMVATDIHWGYSDWADRAWVASLRRASHEHDPDVVILGGDNGSHDPLLELACFGMVRDTFSKSTVRWVPGNHSYWSTQGASAPETLRFLKSESAKLDVLCLADHPVLSEADHVCVAGFGGWYQTTPRSTNDRYRIGGFAESDRWLRDTASKEFRRASKLSAEKHAMGWKTVMVTHFPFFDVVKSSDWKGQGTDEYFGAPLLWEEQLDGVDTVVFGHTHRAWDGLASNGATRIINPGSDYGSPRNLVIELGNS